MRRKPNTTRVAPLAVGAILSLAAAAASRATAQECQADSDCGDGYTCTTNSATVCNTCPAPYPVDAAIGFPVESVDAGSLPPALFPSADAGPGSPVGPTDPGTQPPDLPSEDAGMGFPVDPSDGGVAWIDDGGTCNSTCTSYEYHTCERKACTSDSDCPSDMVCHTETWQDCSGPMCKPDTGCDVDASFTCTEQTQSTCTERYYLPCATDEACGDGFECDKSPYTICSGGGAVMPADDGGFVVVDAGSSCTTETPDTGFCNLLELPCEGNADCPSGLSCQLTTSYPPCVAPAQDAATAPVDGGVMPWPSKEEDAGAVFFDCPPPVTSMLCRPERWASDGGTTAGGGGAFGGGTSSGGVPVDAGAAVPPEGPGGSAAGTSGGTGSGSSASSDAGATSDDDDDGTSHGHHRDLREWLHGFRGHGGCSVGAAQSADANLPWFALVSALLVWRSRRRAA